MRDVIVIGAGGGGPVVAKELAARGLDVLILEGGARNDDAETRFTRLEGDANNPLWGYLRYGSSNRNESWWLRDTPQNSYVWQVAGVGGTTLHYFGNCPRAVPGTFAGYAGADRSAYDIAHQFPFTYEQLRPYYEWVEATLPVQTAPMGTKEAAFFRGCEGIGLPVQTSMDITKNAFRPQQNCILQPGGHAGLTGNSALLTYPQATGCTFCGYCLEGCIEPRLAPVNLKAKRSTNNSYVPMALTANLWSNAGKAATLIADAYVTRILTTPTFSGPKASGVTWRDEKTGATHTETAKVIVLCGGTIESPRLWLNSGLPNPNGWVGAGVTDHAFDWVTGVFDEDTNSSQGPSSAARVDFPGHGGLENVGLPPGFQSLALLLSDSGIRGSYDAGRGITGAWDGESGRPVGAELVDMMQNVNKLLNILVLTDDDVEQQNRVLQSPLPGDNHGRIPKVRMHKRTRSSRTLANREYLATQAANILKAAGAKKVLRIDMAPILLHLQSSMRMGQLTQQLGNRPNRTIQSSKRPLHRRQLRPRQLLRRLQPHPHHTSRRHPNKRKHLHHLLRRRQMGQPRNTHQLHRPPRHPRRHNSRNALTNNDTPNRPGVSVSYARRSPDFDSGV